MNSDSLLKEVAYSTKLGTFDLRLNSADVAKQSQRRNHSTIVSQTAPDQNERYYSNINPLSPHHFSGQSPPTEQMNLKSVYPKNNVVSLGVTSPVQLKKPFMYNEIFNSQNNEGIPSLHFNIGNIQITSYNGIHQQNVTQVKQSRQNQRRRIQTANTDG